MAHFIPHTHEWFQALESNDPEQAEMTRQLIERAGRSDICGVCGNDTASDYMVRDLTIGGVDATTRLCDDCRMFRLVVYREKFAPL